MALALAAKGLALDVKSLARALGFDLAGVARAGPSERTRFLPEWLERGYGGAANGPLAYVMSHLAERVDPGKLLAGRARSLVAVALSYGGDAAHHAASLSPTVARYARGDDYHEILLDRLSALSSGVEVLAGCAVESKAWVDTGPVLERVVAAAAGLGWQGKNTLLIHPDLGSYLFLGVLITDLALEPDAAEADHCGACRACLDACPTAAFPEPYVLDATRCISYSTIEDSSPIPLALRAAHGTHLFGCDVCQEVCPWNRPTRVSVPSDPLGLRTRLLPRKAWEAPTLAWVLGLDEDAWRVATRDSALRRAKWRSLLRNALVVAGNSRDASLRPLVLAHARGEDSLLAEHADWALARLDEGADSTRQAGSDALDQESDGVEPSVPRRGRALR